MQAILDRLDNVVRPALRAPKASVEVLRLCVRVFWHANGMRTWRPVIWKCCTTKLSEPFAPSAA